MNLVGLYIERWITTQYKKFFNNILSTIFVFTVCLYAVRKGVFENYDDTKTMLFSISMVLIWIGLFDTISIFSDEYIYTKDSFDKSLPLYAYLFGTIIIQTVLCVVQSLVSLVIYSLFFDFSSKGIVFPSIYVDYFITFFLILLSSNILGLGLGTFVSTISSVLRILPTVLIAQLLLSGCLFDLDGILSNIADFTTAKYGFNALGAIANLNSEELPLKISATFPEIPKTIKSIFEYSSNNVEYCWLHLVIIIIICLVFTFGSLYIKINSKEK